MKNHTVLKNNDFVERRVGPPDRRGNHQDPGIVINEQRAGLPDRRVATDDRNVKVITGTGEHKGTINLNSAYEKVHRVSDFFIKTDIAFLPLYNTVVKGASGGVTFINIKDVAVIIPEENLSPGEDEPRQDADIRIQLKFGMGQIKGKINLLGETRQTDRISDLLNCPEKRWLTVYEADYMGKTVNSAIINLYFISSVEDQGR